MSSPVYEVREGTTSDARSIAETLRGPDVDELWAAAHLLPYEALMLSFMVSRDTCFTGTADGKPVCMFGVKKPTLINTVAVPWMLASDNIEFHSRTFLRESRKIVRILADKFPYMQNYVDARNEDAIRWLQWVGFSVYYPKPRGPENLPFHRFDMGTRHV